MKYLKYLLLIIGLLLVVFFGKGLLTSSVAYNCEIMVDKPIEEAWAVMSDELKVQDWIEGYKKAELVSGTANTVGAVSNIHFVDQGQEMIMQETITAIEPNKRIAMTFTMDFMDMDYEMLLSKKDGKTLISTSSDTKGNGLFAKSMVSWMPGAMKAQEEKNLVKLKQVIEDNTKNYFPEPVLEAIPVEVSN